MLILLPWFVPVLLNLFGYTLGYYIPKLFKYDKRICRTIAIEVGMQNSGLSVALAIKYFSAIAALPGAIFQHLAKYFRFFACRMVEKSGFKD